MTQVEIDEALARSDDLNELQDTRALAAAYRQEKALLATMTAAADTSLHLAQLEIAARKQECQTVTRKRDAAEAERDAAAESCRLMADRVERLVEANLGLQARIDDDEWRKVYEIERDNAKRLVEANLGLRDAALAYADLATCYRLGKAPSEGLFHRLDIARDALGKEGSDV